MTLAVDEPPALVAVSVYVVVAVGATWTLVPVTVPTPGAMERVSAPLTDQESVAVPPEATAVGEARKPWMIGLRGVMGWLAPLKQPEAERASARRAAAGRAWRGRRSVGIPTM